MNPALQKILISALILGILITQTALHPSLAQAAENRVAAAIGNTLSECLSWNTLKTVGMSCIATILGEILSVAIGATIVPLLHLAGFIFNSVLGLSLDNVNYTIGRIAGVGAGWTFSRDLVNIFLIFTLLFIAIATILGIESYGAKTLLVRLIIIALLVNFSLLATQAIIFVSNTLAGEIYNTIAPGTTFGGTLFNTKFKNDIASRVVNPFRTQRLLVAGSAAQGVIQKSASDATAQSFGILFVQIASVFVIVAAMFVLVMGAFFFLTRTVILWLLMILAPFGFFFLILPLTRGYAQNWWKKLTDQAIFAPTFMFLLAISILILNGLQPFFDNASEVAKNSINEFIALAVMQALLAGIMFIAVLIVSKQMGIYGSDTAMGWASGAGKWFRGAVWGATRRGAVRAGGAVAKGAGGLAEKAGLTRLAERKYLGAPFRIAGKPFAAMTRAAEKEKAELENRIKGMSSTAFAATYRATANPLRRREMLKAAADASKVDKLNANELQEAYNQFKDKPTETKAYNNVVKVRPDLIEKDTSLSAADRRAKMTDALSRMSEKDIEEKLDREAFNPANALTQELMVLAWGEREMAAALRKHGEAARDAVNRGLAAIGPPAAQFDVLYNNNKSFLRGLFRNPSLALPFGILKGSMQTQARAAYPADWEQRLGIK